MSGDGATTIELNTLYGRNTLPDAPGITSNIPNGSIGSIRSARPIAALARRPLAPGRAGVSPARNLRVGYPAG